MPRRTLACLTICLLLLVAAPLRAKEEAEPPEAAGEAAALRALVESLQPLVSSLRGLPWKREVPAEVLSRDALRALLKEKITAEYTDEELERDTRITRRLGILGPDEDLLGLQLQMLEEMVAGAYDPETQKLYLVAGFDGEAQKPTLIHELTHALDDQHYDLQGLEKPYRDDDPDRQFAIRCLFEGSAEFARRAYQDREPDVAAEYYKQVSENQEMVAGQQRVMKLVPAHMLIATFMHYRMGSNFVARAVDAAGGDYARGMQRLFADPPTTQEQILHPHKWLGARRDHPRKVVWGADLAKAAGPDWKTLDEHSVGELDLAVYLDYFLGDLDGRLNLETLPQGKYVTSMANRAARGWDAGRALYLDRGDGHIVLLQAYAFDSEKDASEAADVLGAALRKANGKEWVGLGWESFGQGDALRYFDFAGRYGVGSILQRDREVLMLDGAPADVFQRLWPAFERTSFVRLAEDQGDLPDDPFEGCAVVDAHRGLGLRLPGTTWKAEQGGRTPFSFATATNGAVRLEFLVLDQEMTKAGLPRMGNLLLGGMFDLSATQPARVMGSEGLYHPLPAGPNRRGRLYMGSDAARTYVVIAGGEEPAWDAAAQDIQAFLDGEHGPGSAGAAAGIWSVPGY